MSTFIKPSSSIEPGKRTVVITDIAVGDKFDFVSILGRSAKKIKFTTTDAADVIEFRRDNLVKRQSKRPVEEALSDVDRIYGVFQTENRDVWIKTDALTLSGLEPEINDYTCSLEITDLTLSSGAVVTAEVS